MPYPPPAACIVVRSARGEHENDATNSLEVHSQRANSETNGDTIEPDRNAREKARRDV
jgi:hypothetical protein